MKKSGLIIVIVLLSAVSSHAQFFNAIGISAGVTYAKEGWSEEQWATQEQYLLRYNGAVLAEFFDDPIYQWRSEIMYNVAGTKELVITNKYSNTTTYLSFNNYLKYKREFFKFMPYVLIGPRIEYLFSRAAGVFPDVIGGMSSVHVSAAVGLGAELVTFGRLKPFVEIFYNHDIMPSFSGSVASISPYLPGVILPETINSHDFELRIGVKYVFKPKDKCPKVDNKGAYKNGIQ